MNTVPVRSTLTNDMEVEEATSSEERKKEDDRGSRRSRGLISCAECRRLKLKCDKQIPCSSCVRRGCMALCPNGVQLSKENHGTRHPPRPRLVDKERLRAQVLEMGERIRKLENELRILHSCHSPDIHPLLSEELLRVKASVESDRVTSRRTTSSEVDDQFLESFGTLAVSDGGTERFLGSTGTTERLLQLECLQFRGFPPPAIGVADGYRSDWRLLPEPWKHNEKLVELVKSHLPSREHATQLCNAYLENVSWFCRPIRGEQIFEELLPALYSDQIGQMDVHDLALILATLSAGAAGDLSLPAYNQESELFYELSTMALSMKPLLDSDGASLSTVQTLMLGGMHHLVSGRVNSLEPIWKIQSFACLLALSIGLHRDPANWKLEEKLVQRRRQVFWELFVIDKWKSLACGRPPSFKLGDIDCLFPDDTDATDDQDGNIVASPWHWKIRFCKEVASRTIEKFCSSKSVTYAEVLELDRIIEDFTDHLVIATPDTASQTYRTQQPSDVLRYVAVHLYRSISLIHVHRGFFAEALMKFPMNPLDSPFAHSFSAAYRGAVKLLGVLRTRFDELSPLLIRMWPMWAHSLTSAVIVGSVALHCRGSPMAAPAAIELDHAITLFEKAIIHPVVETGLPILLRLRNRARDHARHDLRNHGHGHGNRVSMSMSSPGYRHDASYPTDVPILRRGSAFGHGGGSDDERDDEDDHELSILRGTGDLIAVSAPSSSSNNINNNSRNNRRVKGSQRQMYAPYGYDLEDRRRSSSSSSDPFGLLEYGALSDSQFVQANGTSPGYTSQEYNSPVFAEPYVNGGVMGLSPPMHMPIPEVHHGDAGDDDVGLAASPPGDAWQSFMQTLGIGHIHSL